jgi:Cysteine-rich secretory protein family
MPITPDIPATEVAIVEMTNAFRKQHKLAAVRPNARLEAAARAYARVLAGGHDLSHTLQGTTPATRAQKAGYGYCQIAENLAMASDSRRFSARDYAGRAVHGWKRSPGHRRNLLLPHLTDIGVAVIRAAPDDPRYIAVQLFGRQDSQRYAFKVRNIGKRPVAYEYAGKRYDLDREQYKAHTACLPRDINVFTDTKSKATARYEARDGQVYSLEAGPDGVTVQIGPAPKAD